MGTHDSHTGRHPGEILWHSVDPDDVVEHMHLLVSPHLDEFGAEWPTGFCTCTCDAIIDDLDLEFPELGLRSVDGHVTSPASRNAFAHTWIEAMDFHIFDPTHEQFPWLRDPLVTPGSPTFRLYRAVVGRTR